MTRRSEIPAQTLEAYRQSDYRVFATPPFVLRVDEPSAALRAVHARHGVACSAFVSACNPFSHRLEEACNAARHRALQQALARDHLPFIEGAGGHPDNGWPSEPSVLVLALTLQAARALAERLEQNAFLSSASEAVPRLVLLR